MNKKELDNSSSQKNETLAQHHHKKLIRNANSQAPTRPTESETLQFQKPNRLHLTSPPGNCDVLNPDC